MKKHCRNEERYLLLSFNSISVIPSFAFQSKGVFTKAGTWCMDEEEAEYIEKAVDYAERWRKNIQGVTPSCISSHDISVFTGKEEWLMEPEVPEDDIDKAIEVLENAEAEAEELERYIREEEEVHPHHSNH